MGGLSNVRSGSACPSQPDRYAGQLPQRRGRVGLCGRSCGNAEVAGCADSAADPDYRSEITHVATPNNPDADVGAAAGFQSSRRHKVVVVESSSDLPRLLVNPREALHVKAAGWRRRGPVCRAWGYGADGGVAASPSVRCHSGRTGADTVRPSFFAPPSAPHGVGWRHPCWLLSTSNSRTLELRRVPRSHPPHDGVVVASESQWHLPQRLARVARP